VTQIGLPFYSLPFYSEKNSFLSHDIAGQSVYCNPPQSLAVQCVEHIRTCHATSLMNTKAVIILLNRQQFNPDTIALTFLHQVPSDTPVLTKPSPLGKRHTVVKVPWPINYWVIYKDNFVKVYPPPMKIVSSSLNTSTTNN
jgi:hypothetical protein